MLAAARRLKVRVRREERWNTAGDRNSTFA